jgi:hypothetical protein
VEKPVQPLTTEADPFGIQAKQVACIHLNGFIKDITAEKLSSTFKLTETSYITASIADSPWATRFREDVRLARAAFFVGYGLYDLDVRRILADSPDLKAKWFFITRPDPDALLLQRLDRFGTAVTIGVRQFGSRAKNFGYTFRPLLRRPLSLRSLVEVFPCRDGRNPSDQDLLNLFELGSVDERAIAACLSQGIPYYLQRSKLKQIVHLLKSGSKAVAVSAALGNGKTLLLRELEIRAFEEGYRVFRTFLQADGAALEFERVAGVEGKVLLIVDNYQNWLSEIRAFRQVKNEQTRLVVTARGSVHDVLYGRLEEECGLASIPEVPVNHLDDDEIEWFAQTLERYGLWRSFAGRSLREKTKFLRERCEGQIHGILLGLLESHDIGDRVRRVMAEAGKDKAYYEVIASVFILNTLNHPPTIDILHDLWGPALLSSSGFRENPAVKQLLSFGD